MCLIATTVWFIYISSEKHNTVWHININSERYIFARSVWHILMTEVTCLDDLCFTSARWVLHIWTSVKYLDDGVYISVRSLHLFTGGIYLDDGVYISGRMLHIWAMEVIHLDGCYISRRRRLHIWTNVTQLDGYISACHTTQVPGHSQRLCGASYRWFIWGRVNGTESKFR